MKRKLTQTAIMVVILLSLFLASCVASVENTDSGTTYDKIIGNKDSTTGRLIYVPENQKVISANLMEDNGNQISYATRPMLSDDSPDTIYVYYAYDPEDNAYSRVIKPIRLVETKNF